MTTAAFQEEVEPFGQRGIRPLVRPLVIALCAIVVAISAAMWFRSQRNYDRFVRVTDGRAIEVASALGRFMVTTRNMNRPMPQADSWSYESQEFTTMYDAWQPSWWKTVGIEWGDEQAFGFGGRRVEYWRFRIAWRTACLAAALPIGIDAAVRRRRRQRDPSFAVMPSRGAN